MKTQFKADVELLINLVMRDLQFGMLGQTLQLLLPRTPILKILAKAPTFEACPSNRISSSKNLLKNTTA